jgi:hypothetical protein
VGSESTRRILHSRWELSKWKAQLKMFAQRIIRSDKMRGRVSNSKRINSFNANDGNRQNPNIQALDPPLSQILRDALRKFKTSKYIVLFRFICAQLQIMTIPFAKFHPQALPLLTEFFLVRHLEAPSWRSVHEINGARCG